MLGLSTGDVITKLFGIFFSTQEKKQRFHPPTNPTSPTLFLTHRLTIPPLTLGLPTSPALPQSHINHIQDHISLLGPHQSEISSPPNTTKFPHPTATTATFTTFLSTQTLHPFPHHFPIHNTSIVFQSNDSLILYNSTSTSRGEIVPQVPRIFHPIPKPNPHSTRTPSRSPQYPPPHLPNP